MQLSETSNNKQFPSTPHKNKGIGPTLTLLELNFPQYFNVKNHKPLKIHIKKDIFSSLKEGAPSRAEIRTAITYSIIHAPLNLLTLFIDSQARIDLNGDEVEAIFPAHKEWAQVQITKDILRKECCRDKKRRKEQGDHNKL